MHFVWTFPGYLLARTVGAAVVCLIALECAHQVGPGGGPADTVPPAVRTSVPQLGAVNVSPKIRIALAFSEWVSPTNIEKTITLFPPPANGIKVQVSGKNIVIVPQPALAESTTYHLEVNNTLRDLHGNPLGAPFQLIFSTGRALDSGRISGCVVEPLDSRLQAKVALFACPHGVLAVDTILFGTPSYLTQCDSFGVFILRYIRPGPYRMIAYADADNDNRFDPGREACAIPLARVTDLRGTMDSVYLFPSRCDTSIARISSVKALGPRTVACLWNRRGFKDTALDSSLRIVAVDTLKKAPGVRVRFRPAQSPITVLSLDTPLSLVPYFLIGRRADPVVDTGAAWDTVRFNGTLQQDTATPALVSYSPKGNAEIASTIKIVWTKPVKMARPHFIFADTAGDTVVCAADTFISDTIRLVPAKRFNPGSAYVARIPDSSVADLFGAHPQDSTGFMRISFSTMAEESLCTSFSGGAACLGCGNTRKWRFTTMGFGGHTVIAPDSCGTFRFDSIGSGKGQLSIFSDGDNDNQPTPGALFPWRSPEAIFSFSDTVEARARWEVEGVSLPACTHCTRKK
jgi:hypothetical protein